MTPPLFHALALRFPGAAWLSVEPARIRKETWYFIQWEDRLGLGQLIVSEREFAWMMAEVKTHRQGASGRYQQQPPMRGET